MLCWCIASQPSLKDNSGMFLQFWNFLCYWWPQFITPFFVHWIFNSHCYITSPLGKECLKRVIWGWFYMDLHQSAEISAYSSNIQIYYNPPVNNTLQAQHSLLWQNMLAMASHEILTSLNSFEQLAVPFVNTHVIMAWGTLICRDDVTLAKASQQIRTLLDSFEQLAVPFVNTHTLYMASFYTAWYSLFHHTLSSA